MQRTKSNFTDKAFLLSTFCEFIKYWKSSKRSRLFIDSVNSNAFVNFSVFLGDPSETHFHPTSQSRRRNPSPKESKRKKSSKKIQRDNERAAQFQAASGEQSRQEKTLQSISALSPLQQNWQTMPWRVSQLSPENLRQQLEDPPMKRLSEKDTQESGPMVSET